jgi:hypothetical protein
MKDVTGRATEPVSEGINMISCFGDNATAEGSPELVPESEDGERATREREYFDWDYICPSQESYRDGLYEMIDDAVEANEDVRLDDVGFPRAEYCHCDQCTAHFEESEYDTFAEWRTATITAFVANVRERIPGDLYLTLYPDPYPGHLERRSGIDPDALAAYVDEFVIPVYDTAYGTTYWLESIVSGFADRLDSPFSVELYAIDIDVDNLIKAARVAGSEAETVLFGYESGNARAALRRMRADESDGVSHGPETL